MRRAFDALAVDFGHNVILLEAGFCGRAVGNDGAENDAAFGGKFQFFGSFAGDLVKFHAEPTRAVSVQKNTYLVIVIVVSQSGGRFELLDGPAILGKGHFRRQICAQFRELADFFLTPLKFCLQLRQSLCEPGGDRFVRARRLRIGRRRGQSDQREAECRDPSGD